MKEEIARERVEILFSKAFDAFATDKKLSKRYVAMARKIAMRARYRLPKAMKRKFCKGCDTLLNSETCKVRAKARRMVYTCLGCGTLKRFKY